MNQKIKFNYIAQHRVCGSGFYKKLMELFGIVGIIIGILTTHIYYKISSKQTSKKNIELSQKLSNNVKQIILNTKKSNLTVKELNKLLAQKTFDKNSSDPLPFIACPKCGNKKLRRGSHCDESSTYYSMDCKKCGWSEWTE